ncbi:MAG: FAD-binding protein [Pseudomonadota bacterium]
MKNLIIAEHDGATIQPATRNTVTAATQAGGEIAMLVIGDTAKAAAEMAATIIGVDSVFLIEDAAYHGQMAEDITERIVPMADDYDRLWAPATTFGKNLMPRIAALLDIQQISDITKVIDANSFERPIYAGNALATVKTAQAKNALTVRATAFDAAEMGSDSTSVTVLDAACSAGLSKFLRVETTKSERPELTTARVVVSGGRGMQNGENFAMLDAMAQTLGAAVGASRAAVDAGFVPNDYQVGQTGKVVAPELYMAIGISGAIQHLAGMKDSKTIVAINKDEDAPIFQIADYGLVADLFEAVPELEGKL